MTSNHVPSFLMTQSALAFVLGLLCAWAVGLGNGTPIVALGIRLDAGLLISGGAAATLLIQRIALCGWKRHVRGEASAMLTAERRLSPAMAAPALPRDQGRHAAPTGRTAVTSQLPDAPANVRP
jgi:hypothetical protein